MPEIPTDVWQEFETSLEKQIQDWIAGIEEHVKEKVEKFNPYHDAQGRFSSEDEVDIKEVESRLRDQDEDKQEADIAHDRLVKYQKDHGSGLTSFNLDALKKYIEDGHKVINDNLRNGQPVLPDVLDALDEAVNNAVLPGCETYRGMYVPSSISQKLVPGTVFEDHGFVSTTTSVALANEFSQPSVADESEKERVMFKINIGQGKKGLAVPGWLNPDEKEVILPRGSRFKVLANQSLTTSRGRGLRQVSSRLITVSLV